MEEIHDKERLKELQALPLYRKIGFTCARITEAMEHFNGKCYVAFSGGKDSTVLLTIARGIYPDIPAVFFDTGLEFPEIRNFVKSFDNVEWFKPKMTFFDVIREYGYPLISKEVAQCIYEGRRNPGGVMASRFVDSEKARKYNGIYSLERYKPLFDSDIPISDRCCKILKKKPAALAEKKYGCPIIATMTDESKLRRTKWLKYGCNSFDGKRPTSNPMSFWTEQDVLEYIYRMKIQIASVYGDVIYRNGEYATTKMKRTGCMLCLFGITQDGTPNRIQRLAETHPGFYRLAIDRLHYDKILDFIGVPWKPVVDNQLNFFDKLV